MTQPSTEEPPEPTFLDVIRASMVTASGLAKLPKPAPLVDDVLFRDSLCWIYGSPGCCKSFIALDLAGCIGTGEMWQGHRVVKGTVLYLVAEGATGIFQRIQAWEASMGVEMGSGVIFLPMPVQAGVAAHWDALVQAAVEIGPIFIVIDTQARVTVGMEENSAKEMGEFVHRLEQLRAATQACVLTVHHTGRGGEHMRGSIAMDGAAHTVIKVSKTDELVQIECDKQKDSIEFDKINLRLTVFEPSAILSPMAPGAASSSNTPAANKLKVAWWTCFETDWVSAGVLREATETPKSTFYLLAKALVRAGLVEEKGEGAAKRYRLTQNPGVQTVQSSPT